MKGKNSENYPSLFFQVMDVTGREEEEVIVALHDCDNDTNRAIMMLLEGGNDQVQSCPALNSLKFPENTCIKHWTLPFFTQ